MTALDARWQPHGNVGARLRPTQRLALLSLRERLGGSEPPAPVAAAAEPEPTVTWSWKQRWQRWLLTALGFNKGAIAMLTDERRYSITVTHHATLRQGERHGHRMPLAVMTEVATAIRDGRVGKKAPGWRKRATRGARLAWTPDASRCYVIYRAQRGWVVLTTLPDEARSDR